MASKILKNIRGGGLHYVKQYTSPYPATMPLQRLRFSEEVLDTSPTTLSLWSRAAETTGQPITIRSVTREYMFGDSGIYRSCEVSQQPVFQLRIHARRPQKVHLGPINNKLLLPKDFENDLGSIHLLDNRRMLGNEEV